MLDEPLGSLDRLIRDRLIEEIAELLSETGTPAIYVTHDHDEARALSDRVALMRAGRIVQRGSWRDLERNPVDDWVARFIGE